jgi:hypothetical protein
MKAEKQSIRENDFECSASTGVNTPGAMFPDSVPRILDFPHSTSWRALLSVCNCRLARQPFGRQIREQVSDPHRANSCFMRICAH